jgi:arsenate reductase
VSTDTKKTILFICTHNSARSQIAEALINRFNTEKYHAHSAGTEPTTVNPYTIKVMAELGIDISGNQTKHVNVYKGRNFDYVVTVCDHAKETCPFFPGAKKYLHQGFTDPSTFTGTEEEKLSGFRRVRDEIKSWIESTFNQED